MNYTDVVACGVQGAWEPYIPTCVEGEPFTSGFTAEFIGEFNAEFTAVFIHGSRDTSLIVYRKVTIITPYYDAQ